MSASESTRRRNATRHTTGPEQVVPATKRENENGHGPATRSPRPARSPARQLIRQGLLAIGLCSFLFGVWNVRRYLCSIQPPFQIPLTQFVASAYAAHSPQPVAAQTRT